MGERQTDGPPQNGEGEQDGEWIWMSQITVQAVGENGDAQPLHDRELVWGLKISMP